MNKITMFKKGILIFFGILLVNIFVIPHKYSVDDAVTYLNEHAENKSRNMCALYVKRAINAGGQPICILPAWAYANVLPSIGFYEVDTKDYHPKNGDVVVFPKVEGHIWGHIAMYNGNRWVSDFKQKGFYVASAYRNSKYRIFRHKS